MSTPWRLRFPLSVSLLFNSARQEKKTSLDIVPNDVLVDVLFNFLDVPEILAMRQVSKLYYALSYQPVVWRRLLRRTELPLPPLRPRYTLDKITGPEAEHFLRRAYDVEKIWLDPPEQTDRWSFDPLGGFVAEMTMTAGGQYLLVSISNEEKHNWRIMVYVIRDKGKVVPIAEIPTRTKAYSIKTKWVTMHGERGLMINYIRRDFRARVHRGLANVSEYPTFKEFISDYPLKYEVHTCHVGQQELERLAGYDDNLPLWSDDWVKHFQTIGFPFRHPLMIRSLHELRYICDDETRDGPVVTVVKGPNTIMIKPLESDARITIHIRPHFEYVQYDHKIKAIRPLPQQRQILVIREIAIPFGVYTRPVTTFELIDIPTNETKHPIERTVGPVDHFFTSEAVFQDAWFTDHCLPNLYEDCPKVRKDWLEGRIKPKPIHAFFRKVWPHEGAVRMTFFPRKGHRIVDDGVDEKGEKKLKRVYYWKYDLKSRSILRNSRPPTAQTTWKYRVYPGTRRTFLTSSPAAQDYFLHDSVWKVHRYHNEEIGAEQRRRESQVPLLASDWTDSVKHIPFDVGGILRFEAVAFDELSGRMMFARPDVKEIDVVEFSRPPKQEPPPSQSVLKSSKLWMGLGVGAFIVATRSSPLIELAQRAIGSYFKPRRGGEKQLPLW